MHENERILKFSPLIRNLYNSARETLGFEPHVSISIIDSSKNANNPLGKTAHYSPGDHKIALYTRGRHIKDIMRSLAHELVHHNQNCRGDFENAGGTMPGYAQEDGHMREMEREAYEVGNLIFRDWEDKLKDKGGKPLFTSTDPYVPAPTSGVVGGRLVEENKMKNKLTKSELQKIIAEEFGTLVEQGTGPFGSDPEKFAKARGEEEEEPIGRDPREKPDTRGFATKPDMSKMMDIPKPPPGLEADSPSAPLGISLDLGGELERAFDTDSEEGKARDAAEAPGAKRRGWRKTNRTIADAGEKKGMLYRGHRGEGVKELQRLLGVEPVDGKFGKDTQKAVIKFQKDSNLTQGRNGIVGPETAAELAKLKASGSHPWQSLSDWPKGEAEDVPVAPESAPSDAGGGEQGTPQYFDRRTGLPAEETPEEWYDRWLKSPEQQERNWWSRTFNPDWGAGDAPDSKYYDVPVSKRKAWNPFRENKKMNKSKLQQIIREVIQEESGPHLGALGRGEYGGGALDVFGRSGVGGQDRPVARTERGVAGMNAAEAKAYLRGREKARALNKAHGRNHRPTHGEVSDVSSPAYSQPRGKEWIEEDNMGMPANVESQEAAEEEAEKAGGQVGAIYKGTNEGAAKGEFDKDIKTKSGRRKGLPKVGYEKGRVFEDSEGEETYHYGEDEGEDKKRLSKGDLSRGHKVALKKDMAYDEEHEDRREKGTHFRESFFPKDRSVRDKARKELNEGLMKRWGFTKKEK